jgi:hypothetical protein
VLFTLVPNLPPVLLIPVANLPPVSTKLVKLAEKLATGIVDTGGAPRLVNISANFQKNIGLVLMEYSGAGGKLIHEKNQKQKIS